MTLSRKDFVRLTVVTLGGGALGLGFPACGSPSTETDAGTGGGSAATGGGSAATGGGSASTGGGGGSSTGGGGGSSTGGGGGSSTGGGGGASTGGGGGASTGGGGGASSTCATNGATASTITANHGHSLMVPAADFTASGDKTYDITGTSLHMHSITLTAAQRATILAGTSVTVTSTSSGHTHDVTVTCA